MTGVPETGRVEGRGEGESESSDKSDSRKRGRRPEHWCWQDESRTKRSASYLRDHGTRREPGTVDEQGTNQDTCLIRKLQTKTVAHRIALYERPWRDRAHANALYKTMAYCNTPVRVHV